MKKIGLALIGFIAGVAILSMVGPLGGLLFSGAIAYAGLHFYIKADNSFSKVVWALVGIAGALTAVANFPGMFAVLAIVALVYVYNNWSKSAKPKKQAKQANDPFQNFEKEWSNMTK